MKKHLLTLAGVCALLLSVPAWAGERTVDLKDGGMPCAMCAPAAQKALKKVGRAATGALPTPLPSDLFTDRVQAGYKVAEEIPDILAGLTCYCGCDRSQGHRHLLDCFVDDHAVG